MTLEQLTALFDLALSATGRHDEGTRHQLERLGLLDDVQITPRGQAFIEHVCALPLPERVTAWRVLPRIAMNGGAFIEDLGTFGTAALHISGIEDQCPPGPPVRPKRIIPTDPEELRREANRLLDTGLGMMEVASDLELTQEQINSIFYGSQA